MKLGGHLLMEILLGTGFAAVAFTGIALQVSSVKKEQVHQRVLFELEVRAKDHLQAKRTGATPQAMAGLEVREGEESFLVIKSRVFEGKAIPEIQIPLRSLSKDAAPSEDAP